MAKFPRWRQVGRQKRIKKQLLAGERLTVVAGGTPVVVFSIDKYFVQRMAALNSLPDFNSRFVAVGRGAAGREERAAECDRRG